MLTMLLDTIVCEQKSAAHATIDIAHVHVCCTHTHNYTNASILCVYDRECVCSVLRNSSLKFH